MIGAHPAAPALCGPRKYRVTVCVCNFSVVELEANHPSDVARRAAQLEDTSAPAYSIGPTYPKLEVQRRKDPKDPQSELEWAEVKLAPHDPFNPDGPKGWQIAQKKNERLRH